MLGCSPNDKLKRFAHAVLPTSEINVDLEKKPADVIIYGGQVEGDSTWKEP